MRRRGIRGADGSLEWGGPKTEGRDQRTSVGSRKIPVHPQTHLNTNSDATRSFMFSIGPLHHHSGRQSFSSVYPGSTRT